MNKFNNVDAIAQSNVQSTLSVTGRTYESFIDLLNNNDSDGGDELGTEGQEVSRPTLDQVNRELADIALAEAALAIGHDETFNAEWLKERAEGSLKNPECCQPTFFPGR